MKNAAWLLLAVSVLNLQCGYRLSGRGRNLPPAAQTIAIPDFKNQTSRQAVEQFITFAVRDEFIKRSRLRLADSDITADLVLEGKITAFETTPISYSEAGAANLYEVRLTLDVRLIDMKTSELYYQGSGMTFREIYETDSADFFSQETGSLVKIAAKFASSIVASILENF
ncbi:MAG: CsgG/HfaB family protein [Acidobacteria bacterium]|nr:CsgG/HfaB family protein [Acidobacteriota bacterium]MBU4307638.1 CsgG/HfaB family protein [Acidobacteriota bacterium]MBU4404390.1 CsgG/HfaB family protein [Acidobacteriota bacterium]MCG2810442.1 CsgG/HfaB family protein [Candidatus Aminicenantes bacterium]